MLAPPVGAVRPGQLEPGDEGRRGAADPVEEGHQLRHLGHRDPPGRRHAERGADGDRGEDQRRRARRSPEKKATSTARHRAAGADQVAAPRGAGEDRPLSARMKQTAATR